MFREHTEDLSTIVVLPSERVLSAGDNVVRIWSWRTGETVAAFDAESPITACAAAPDGETIVAGDEAGRVHLLRLQGVTPGS